MDGYYDDYHPQVSLRCPIALVGVLTEPARRLGHWLAAMEGLPFVDLDRRVEHTAGCSLWALVAARGEAHYRALEARALDAALRERPAGVLVGGDGLALASANRDRLRAQTHWVGLTASAATLTTIAQQAAQVPSGHWHPTRREVLMDSSQIEDFRALRVSALAEAAATVDLDGYDRRGLRSRIHSELPVVEA